MYRESSSAPGPSQHTYLATTKYIHTHLLLASTHRTLANPNPSRSKMCFQIIPLCPACEEPSGLGEEIIFAEDVCDGTCSGDDVCGATTRLMTRAEVENPDFDCCLTPGCRPRDDQLSSAGGAGATTSTPAEVQGARDCARRFLRERYEGCLSFCILPSYEPWSPSVQVGGIYL